MTKARRDRYTAKPDAHHAKAIRTAIGVLEDLIRDAAADGVKVRLEIAQSTGFERASDRMTRFQSVRAEIVRPL